MQRGALAVLLGLAAVAWFEFKFVPGHTFLASSSQLYVPMLRHLESPGYLSRDLVATHPDFTYTVYDEATLFLHSACNIGIREALEFQQAACRIAALLGIFLLAQTVGLKPIPALAVAVVINLGTFIRGPDIWLFNPEPVPQAFAIGFIFLAMGGVAVRKPLFGAFFGGVALLYDPAISAPFWLTLLIAFSADRQMRPIVKPMLPTLLVFILMLANLTQLQSGTPESQLFFSQFSSQVSVLEKLRTPELWVSLWPGGTVYLLVAMTVTGAWALARLWPLLNRPLKWMLVMLPLLSLGAVPSSYIALEHFRWSTILRLQPAHMLVYLVALCWLLWLTAAVQACKQSKAEALAWCVLSIVMLAPVAGRLPRQRTDIAVQELATWAETNTWGSSMFLFPDAGRDLYPGVFRAESRRSLWVDWEGGRQMNYYTDLADVWWKRWRETMQGPLSGDHLQEMLSLPIDYYVFKRSAVLGTMRESGWTPAKPVFSNAEFSVYEASTLRILPGRLTLGAHGPPASTL